MTDAGAARAFPPAAGASPQPAPARARTWLLFLTVLVIATAGIVYELVAGAVASYVLGDSVTQFSIVIGVYLSALGLGSWLSRFVDARLARVFVEVELATAIAGGASAPVLFLAYAHTRAFAVLLYAVVALVGTLVGLELPLLIRILRTHVDLKELLARALGFDYVGALVGSLLFSLVLVPRMGLVRTSLAFGILNALVGLGSTWLVEGRARRTMRGARARAVVVIAVLVVGFVQAERITALAEDAIYSDDVVFARQTAYQRVVVTRGSHSFQLFLNGNLQFSSADEYRYHEALVHPAFAAADRRARVLVAGGGDGLALREILRYPDVREVVLVDIDPEMTRIASGFAPIRSLNGGALSDPRVRVVNEDAMVWLGRGSDAFDVAIVDFPDPNNFSLGKLYTTRFYKLVRARLSPGGTMAVQSTSPLFARASFWCIVRTIEAAGFQALPYHTPVPSFGEWGFVLARLGPIAPPARPAVEGLRFLDAPTMASLFVLSADMGALPVEVNRLNNQILVHYYEREWKRWN